MDRDAREQAGGESSPVGGRDATYWSKPVSRLTVGEVGAGASARNVEGRRPVGPIQGFGKMWQKTYCIRLTDAVPPGQVIATWKERFGEFWPSTGRFFGPLTGIAPGEVAVLQVGMAGLMRLSTGVLVLYADDESFTLMTPEGHMFAGWITFSSFERDGSTFAQAQVLMRANDPLYEMGMAFGGHRTEDRFWEQTLRALAAHLGGGSGFTRETQCVDRRRQWRHARNLGHNAALRSFVYGLGAPARAVRRGGGGEPATPETPSGAAGDR